MNNLVGAETAQKKENWTYTSDSCGYMLHFKGKPVSGAGSMGTATHTADGRARHWRHRIADVRMFAEQAKSQCSQLNETKAKPNYFDVPVGLKK